MQTIEECAGRWLVTRADSVHVAKGCYLVLEPKSPTEASFQLYPPWAQSASYHGTARLAHGQLYFEVEAPVMEDQIQHWQFCAGVMKAPSGQRLLYGLAAHGDPHAAGVFGAEEDGSGG